MSQEFPGQAAISQLDADIARLKTFLNELTSYTTVAGAQVESVRLLVERIKALISESDAEVQAMLVRAEAALETMKMHFKGDWATGTDYIVNDTVAHGGNWYLCVEAHTSGSSFDVDLSAGKWLPYFSGYAEVSEIYPGLAAKLEGVPDGAVFTKQTVEGVARGIWGAVAEFGDGYIRIGKHLICFGSTDIASPSDIFKKEFAAPPTIVSLFGSFHIIVEANPFVAAVGSFTLSDKMSLNNVCVAQYYKDNGAIESVIWDVGIGTRSINVNMQPLISVYKVAMNYIVIGDAAEA